MKNIFIIASAAVSLCLMTALGATAASGVNPTAKSPAESMVMSVCQKCHEPDGDSVSPRFPRLNAQQAEYIVNQLENIRGHKRTDTHYLYMSGVVRNLDPAMMAGLAKYFAGQHATLPQTGGALAAEGEIIFTKGVPAQGITACQNCHGSHGEGSGSFPRIAGQHAAYLRMVLGAFRSNLRDNKTMHPITQNMTDRQIEALASYLAND